MKKNLKYLLILLGLLVLIIGLLYWRHQRLKKSISLSNESNLTPSESELLIENQFPIEAFGPEEWRRLDCDFQEIILHTDYYKTPILAGDWRCLAEIVCAYYNYSQNLETLHLPLQVYNPSTQQMLLVGSQYRIRTEAEAIRLAEQTSLTWYENMLEDFFLSRLDPGKEIQIIINFPNDKLTAGQTQGAAFSTVEADNPPYTEEDLLNFYQSGDTSYLPNINNKTYFWPVAGYSW